MKRISFSLLLLRMASILSLAGFLLMIGIVVSYMFQHPILTWMLLDQDDATKNLNPSFFREDRNYDIIGTVLDTNPQYILFGKKTLACVDNDWNFSEVNIGDKIEVIGSVSKDSHDPAIIDVVKVGRVIVIH